MLCCRLRRRSQSSRSAELSTAADASSHGLDGVDDGLLGHAVGRAAHGASHVRAVTLQHAREGGRLGGSAAGKIDKAGQPQRSGSAPTGPHLPPRPSRPSALTWPSQTATESTVASPSPPMLARTQSSSSGLQSAFSAAATPASVAPATSLPLLAAAAPSATPWTAYLRGSEGSKGRSAGRSACVAEGLRCAAADAFPARHATHP